MAVPVCNIEQAGWPWALLILPSWRHAVWMGMRSQWPTLASRRRYWSNRRPVGVLGTRWCGVQATGRVNVKAIRPVQSPASLRTGSDRYRGLRGRIAIKATLRNGPYTRKSFFSSDGGDNDCELRGVAG